MIIVYAGTRNLYRKMLPSIRSLLAHNDVERIIILAEDDAFPEDVALPEVCEVRNVLPLRDKYFRPNGPNIRNKFTWMAMMRALYPDLFPDLDRVIQLDVDTIVCDSLMPIWDISMGGKWFAAVEEAQSTWKPFGPVYYNIGVAVFNLTAMREWGVTRRLVRALNTRELRYVDQDALNMFAPTFGVDLPVRYNETFVTGYTDSPAVVHFAGYPDWWCREDMPRREYLERWKRPGDDGPEFAEA